MSLNLLAMPVVFAETPKEATNTKLGQALDRFAAYQGVVSIWVPESRWPFLDLPPQIVWRGEQCRALALAVMAAHKVADYRPVRVYVGDRIMHVQSTNSQTVGVVLEPGCVAAKSVGRMMKKLLALAAERT